MSAALVMSSIGAALYRIIINHTDNNTHQLLRHTILKCIIETIVSTLYVYFEFNFVSESGHGGIFNFVQYFAH